MGFSIAIVYNGSSTLDLFRYPVFSAATTSTAIMLEKMMMVRIMRMSRGGMRRLTVFDGAWMETGMQSINMYQNRPDGIWKENPARRKMAKWNRTDGTGNRPDGNGRRK